MGLVSRIGDQEPSLGLPGNARPSDPKPELDAGLLAAEDLAPPDAICSCQAPGDQPHTLATFIKFLSHGTRSAIGSTT